MLDFRSDTVTRPDEAMRRAMAAAEVGDDVYREDPTAIRLEERAAEIVGTQAALFTPSGTMANQIALHLHGSRGEEVVGEGLLHVFHYEMGAMSALSGLFPRPVAGRRGLLEPADLEAAIQPDLEYKSRTRILVLENTHNLAGGIAFRPEVTAPLLAVARRHGLAVHLDGARLFNAAVALDLRPSDLTAGVDSVMISLSKGLGCPVGGLLCGPAGFVAEARRVRKMLGGGMRQVGVLAAAGLLALERGFDHLRDDHANARRLAAGLAELPGVTLDEEALQTNILMVELAADEATDPTPAARFVAWLREREILASAISATRVRFVTHRDVGRDAVEEALGRLGG
jgi:threonine aldolase